MTDEDRKEVKKLATRFEYQMREVYQANSRAYNLLADITAILDDPRDEGYAVRVHLDVIDEREAEAIQTFREWVSRNVN